MRVLVVLGLDDRRRRGGDDLQRRRDAEPGQRLRQPVVAVLPEVERDGRRHVRDRAFGELRALIGAICMV
jgi:hypothetical protein